MAVYVISDLHGTKLDALKQLLSKVNFNENDWLFILGDIVDRQNDGGVEILKWLLHEPNAELILGNHEAMLLSCDFVFDEITNESIDSLDGNKLKLLTNYMHNGGDVTLKALKTLLRSSPEVLYDILEYLREAPLYETVSAGGKDFLLTHSGLGNFHPDKKLSEYTADELLWTRPEIGDNYFDDVITVFGHTPTVFYDHQNKGKILRTNTWIDIDVGVHCGNSPALLRLDDLKEFYL